MILILADDFTGAAELAGIAAKHGLSAEVQSAYYPESAADVIAVDTRSRSLHPIQAAEKIAVTYEQYRSLKPRWIFKKTDSALRGNIAAELQSLSKATGIPRILFIPANPSKARSIVQGEYRINDIPISQTVFCRDPEHPIRTSRVIDIFPSNDGLRIHSIRANEPSPRRGLIVPDIETEREVHLRANELTQETLAAGAADFFNACLLANEGPQNPPPPIQRLKGKRLLICGSLAAWDQGIAEEANLQGIPVLPLQSSNAWIKQAQTKFDQHETILIAAGRPVDQSPSHTTRLTPDEILGQLIATASALLQSHQPSEVFVEGGATSVALFDAMGWTQFHVLPTKFPGIGCLAPFGVTRPLNLFVKPGSYPWPLGSW